MSRSPESLKTPSHPTSRRSRTPLLESESDIEASESESDGSPEPLRCYPTPTKSSRAAQVHQRLQTTSRNFDGSRTSRNRSPASDSSSRPKSSQSCGKKGLHGGMNVYNCCWICVTVVGIVFVILGVLNTSAMNVSREDDQKYTNRRRSIVEAVENLGRNIDSIRGKFKAQYPSIWRDLEAGIAEVIRNPRRPTIFLLFSSDDDPMFCLARMIGNASKTALGSEEDLLLSPEDLGRDYGRALDKLKGRIEKQKVVIVEHLLDIHPEAMKAFHNLCDRDNPLVKEAIYILTMVVEAYQNESLPEFVEDQLTQKLAGKISREKLQPLISRMTDGAIIHVQPEPSVKSCPLRY